jgi:uncharacterized protein
LTAYFVDTSALAKRYLNEVGAAWVRALLDSASGHIVFIAEIALVEMRSLLARRVREGSLSTTQQTILWGDYSLHSLHEYGLIVIDRPLLDDASNLVDRYPLRALDAIQLACAVRAQKHINISITFISADANLLTAATAEGFGVDNPLNHP